MATLADLTGKVIGRLTVVERAENSHSGNVRWLCICSCGNMCVVLANNLAPGKTVSCGCVRRKHGLTSKDGVTKKHPLYATWAMMRQRCNNPKCKDYPRYGGSGIKICKRWDSFENFLADMGERPEGTTLDRYPNNAGNYEPDNCRWATASEQEKNKKPYRRGVAK